MNGKYLNHQRHTDDIVIISDNLEESVTNTYKYFLKEVSKNRQQNQLSKRKTNEQHSYKYRIRTCSNIRQV